MSYQLHRDLIELLERHGLVAERIETPTLPPRWFDRKGDPERFRLVVSGKRSGALPGALRERIP